MTEVALQIEMEKLLAQLVETEINKRLVCSFFPIYIHNLSMF